MSPASFNLQEVRIRMYRPGLGDCFLVKFIGDDGATPPSPQVRTMLIDCGVLQGTPGDADRLGKIVQDIQNETSGTDSSRGKLNILVGTHEHADHLAGFAYHHDIFQNDFDIDEVWLPWTEQTDDPKVAALFSKARAVAFTTLQEAQALYQKLSAISQPDPATKAEIQKVLDFINPGQMHYLKDLVKDKDPKALRYLDPNNDTNKEPTTIVTRPDFGEIRFHVLGPPTLTADPKSIQSILRSDPPKSVQQLRSGDPFNQVTAFSNAIQRQNSIQTGTPDPDIEEIYQMCLPFDQTRAIPIDKAKQDQDPFFKDHYGFSEEKDNGPAWRRIDTDWLDGAGEMALALDSDTNNTSLVLAIELPGKGTEPGKIMLFPGDAQYGSWTAWVGTQKGKSILSNVVFYKVGHHGSYNATLIPGGLDQMTNPNLVAMIPVDPQRVIKWNMPNPGVLNGLLKQTHGRVIQACQGKADTDFCDCFKFIPPDNTANLAGADWQQFIDRIKWDESADMLWVEYTLEP